MTTQLCMTCRFFAGESRQCNSADWLIAGSIRWDEDGQWCRGYKEHPLAIKNRKLAQEIARLRNKLQEITQVLPEGNVSSASEGALDRCQEIAKDALVGVGEGG